VLVMQGLAPDQLLDSYDGERTFAADENILNSTRSTDFITPKSAVSRTFRDAVLQLAKRHPFARRLVNSGRLSVPAVLHRSPLNTPDRDADFGRGRGAMVAGAAATDAPVTGPRGEWLLGYLGGEFTLLAFGPAVSVSEVVALAAAPVPCRVVQVDGAPIAGATPISDTGRYVAERYDGRDGTCYLFRPDQHVCARWRTYDAAAVRAALARATCR